MINKKKINGLTVFVKDNDSFYESILLDFLACRLCVKKVFRSIPDTKVVLIETERGLMVLKVFVPKSNKIERILKSFVKKDYYENLIIQTDRVRSEGVTSINDYYLLAEAKLFNYSYVYIMLIEYIEGVGLECIGELTDDIKRDIKNSIYELHSHNMVSGDPHWGNFIVTKDGIKLIDLSGKKCNSQKKAKDRIDLERHFGITNEIKDFGYNFLIFKKKVRYIVKEIKYKLGLSKKSH